MGVIVGNVRGNYDLLACCLYERCSVFHSVAVPLALREETYLHVFSDA